MDEPREWMYVDFRKDIRMAKKVDFGAHRHIFQVWILGSEGTACAEPPTFKPMEEGAMMPDPTFEIAGDEVQWLMDELWRAGVRPSEIGTAGHLGATQYHLEDMRRLVFKEEKREQK